MQFNNAPSLQATGLLWDISSWLQWLTNVPEVFKTISCPVDWGSTKSLGNGGVGTLKRRIGAPQAREWRVEGHQGSGTLTRGWSQFTSSILVEFELNMADSFQGLPVHRLNRVQVTIGQIPTMPIRFRWVPISQQVVAVVTKTVNMGDNGKYIHVCRWAGRTWGNVLVKVKGQTRLH